VQPAEHRQRVFVRGRRVEIARGRQRVVREDGDRRGNDECEREDVLHFFLMSTLRRAAEVSVTVTLWRDSPSCGWRNTMSWRPIVACRLPIGVSPAFSPSSQTSAHGTALTLIDPIGSFSDIDSTLPGATLTLRAAR